MTISFYISLIIAFAVHSVFVDFDLIGRLRFLYFRKVVKTWSFKPFDICGPCTSFWVGWVVSINYFIIVDPSPFLIGVPFMAYFIAKEVGARYE